MSATHNRQLSLVYNRYSTDLLAELQEFDKTVGKEESTNHASTEEDAAIRRAATNMDQEKLKTVHDSFEFYPGISAGRALAIATSTQDKSKVRVYLTVLATLCLTWTKIDDPTKTLDGEALVKVVLDNISKIQQKANDDGDNNDKNTNTKTCASNFIGDDIDDLDVREMLKRLANEVAKDDDGTEGNDDDGTEGMDAVFKALMGGNSKIGKIAKEIANDIDISSIAESLSGGDGGNGQLDISKLFENNGLLGNIVSSVSSKIQQQMANGDSDLVGEAMGIMSSFGNNSFANENNNNKSKSKSKNLDKSISTSTRKNNHNNVGNAPMMPPGMGDFMAEMFKSLNTNNKPLSEFIQRSDGKTE